jgi:hypothetical protein
LIALHGLSRRKVLDFEMIVERFGNAHNPSYAREDLRRLEDDFTSLIGDRCLPNINIYTGASTA